MCVIESVVKCSEILQVKFLLYITEGLQILCVGWEKVLYKLHMGDQWQKLEYNQAMDKQC
jgi:hypothetical protein